MLRVLKVLPKQARGDPLGRSPEPDKVARRPIYDLQPPLVPEPRQGRGDAIRAHARDPCDVRQCEERPGKGALAFTGFSQGSNEGEQRHSVWPQPREVLPFGLADRSWRPGSLSCCLERAPPHRTGGPAGGGVGPGGPLPHPRRLFGTWHRHGASRSPAPEGCCEPAISPGSSGGPRLANLRGRGSAAPGLRWGTGRGGTSSPAGGARPGRRRGAAPCPGSPGRARGAGPAPRVRLPACRPLRHGSGAGVSGLFALGRAATAAAWWRRCGRCW